MVQLWARFQGWLISAAILIGFTALYAYSVGIPFYSSDAQVMYDTAWSIGQAGHLDVSPAPLPQLITATDGRVFSKYDPGLPLLASHIVYYADGVAKQDGADRYAVGAIFVMIIPNISMALANLGTFLIARSLTHSTRRAILAALVAGLGTTVWPYGRLFFAEAITTATFTLAMAWLIVPQRLQARHVFAASILMTIALVTRAHTLIFALSLLYPIWKRAISSTQRWHFLLTYSLTFLISGGIWLVHNWLRFGDFLATGYEGETFSPHPLFGIIGLLVSPGKGVFWYAPPLILSGLIFPRVKHNAPIFARTLILSTVLALLFYGAWWAWHGGWVWGPRFLVPLMPLWCIGWAFIPARVSWLFLAAIVLLLGIGIQQIGTFTNVNPAYSAAFTGASSSDDKTRYAMIHYDLDTNPIVAGWERLRAGDTEPQAIYRLQKTELDDDWVYGVPQAVERWLLISVGVILWGLWRNPSVGLKDKL